MIRGLATISSAFPFTAVLGGREQLARQSWAGYEVRPPVGEAVEVRAGEREVWVGGVPRWERWRGESSPLCVPPGGIVRVVLVFKPSAGWAVFEELEEG